MAGIYIHIPFCRRACHYCNFHFSTSFDKKDELVAAIIEEIKIQAHYLNGQIIETIYFGGGTPSALPPSDIEMIFRQLKAHHEVAEDVEITLEANPDDVSARNAEAWKLMGINRLSIGVQAFQDELLEGWNRNHSANQARESILLAQAAGFSNITADLIYGGESLTDEDWIRNIHTLADLGIPHISSYALTVEKGTVLDHRIKKGQARAPDDEQSNRQYAILQTLLKAAGYEQYEISNFSKPGFQSRHNTSYWFGAHYLGIGPSAHGYNGVSRQWNVANNIKYVHAIQHSKVPFEREMLTDIQRYNEIVMTGLRTSRGIDRNRITNLGESFSKYLDQEVETFINSNGSDLVQPKIFLNELGNYALKPEYYFFADGIAAELFFSADHFPSESNKSDPLPPERDRSDPLPPERGT